MDSSSLLPPTNNHHPPPSTSHPPYADMIYRAIEALKEKNGSTKSAISKYIEQVYNHQLPPESTHSTLLTHHLNQLKDNGLLHMVNDSYILPRSLPPPPSSSLAVQSSRPRGRPRKLQARPQARGSVLEQPNAEPVSAALSLSDEPQDVAVTVEEVGLESESNGPGFSTKSVVGSGVGSEGMVSPRRRGRPPGSKNKKKPCRPATAETSEAAVATVAETSEVGAAVAVASSGTKRRPGRPPKKQKVALVPFVPAAEAPVAMDGDGDDGSVVAKSNAGESAAPFGGGGAGSGRGGGSVGSRGGAMAVQDRSSIGKPVGRPMKGTTSASASQNVADVQNLKRILKYFQSKVRESLEVLKPHFTHESPASAISAIQDLEVVVAMDLDAPPKEEETLPQQPPPPPQQQQPPPPQQQQQPQKFQQLPQQQQHQPPQFRLAPQQQIYGHQFPMFHLPYQPQQFQHQGQQPLQQFQPQLPHHRTFYP